MTTSVQVPIAIRVDRAAVEQWPGDVLDAFRDAVGRALAASREIVVDTRGAYLTVVPTAPVFRWGGDQLASVGRQARHDMEASLSEVLDELIASAGILDGNRAALDAPIPLGDPAEERPDPERLDDVLDTYDVPSYAGGTKKIARTGKRQPTVIHDWIRFKSDHNVTPSNLKSAIRQWRSEVGAGQVGYIFRTKVGHRPAWEVVIPGTKMSSFTFPGFGRYEFAGGKAKVPFRSASFEPSPTIGTATHRVIAGRAALGGVVRDFHAAEIERELRSHYEKAGTTKVAEHAEFIATAVDRELDNRLNALLASIPDGREPKSIVIVSMGSASFLGVSIDDSDLSWTGTAQLIPLTSEHTEVEGDAVEGTGKGSGGDAKQGGDKPRTEPGGDRGTGTGAGSGDGTADGDDGGRGAFVIMPSDGQKGEGGSLFPLVRGLGGWTPTCSSFEGEPSLEQLGPAGDVFKRLIDDIAFRLQMPPCGYAANFCIQAASVIAGRAADISRYIGAQEQAAFTMPARDTQANMGPIHFVPVASPAIQFLRHLAGVFPRLRTLQEAIFATYAVPANHALMTGTWAHNLTAWQLRFWEAMTPAADEGVTWIFLSGCQAMLLQLLLASKDGIDKRIARFNSYAPIFERLMATQMSSYADLSRLRDQLRHHNWAATVNTYTTAAGGDVASAIAATNPATAWFSAARAMSTTLLAAETKVQIPGGSGQIVTEGGVTRIRDSMGLLWTVEELEQAMVAQRGMAEGIDPLVKQMSDIPELMSRFRSNPRAIRDELWRVLNEMQHNNTEMIGKARVDAMFAFKASRIQESIPNATVPGSSIAMQGIHLQAHLQLGEFFAGDRFYAAGIDSLFKSELGKEALGSFFEMVGIVGLSILCPPLGFAVGVGVAVHEVDKAYEKERLFTSMLDPELVLTRAEVEMELFAAYLGLALSILPEIGTIGEAIGRGGKVALRSGVRMGVTAAGRDVVRQATKQIIEAASKDLLERFVVEIATNIAMDKVIQKVMEPVMAYIERQAQITESAGGPQGAQVILAVLASSSTNGSGQ